jgi:hypothetical protein
VGLIKELTLLPVAPLRFTLWVAEQVAEEADRQHASPEAGVRKIDEIEQSKEKGELDEHEAEELQGEIIEQQVTRVQSAEEPGKDAESG